MENINQHLNLTKSQKLDESCNMLEPGMQDSSPPSNTPILDSKISEIKPPEPTTIPSKVLVSDLSKTSTKASSTTSGSTISTKRNLQDSQLDLCKKKLALDSEKAINQHKKDLLDLEVEKIQKNLEIDLKFKELNENLNLQLRTVELSLAIGIARQKLFDAGLCEGDVDALIPLQKQLDNFIAEYFSEVESITSQDLMEKLKLDFAPLLYQSSELNMLLFPFSDDITFDVLSGICRGKTLRETLEPYRVKQGDKQRLIKEIVKRNPTLDASTIKIKAICVKFGYLDIAEAISIANIDTSDELLDPFALIQACKEDNMQSAKVALHFGCDPNQSSNGTALHWASFHGNIDMAKMLLSSAANIEILTENQSTALFTAAFKGSIDMVKFLLSQGADKTVRNNQGKTPLDIALEKGFQSIATLLQMRAEDEFEGNDVVWARNSIGWWPAQIETDSRVPARVLAKKPVSSKSELFPVFYFGTNNQFVSCGVSNALLSVWLGAQDLKDFALYQDQFSKAISQENFVNGLKEARLALETLHKYPDYVPKTNNPADLNQSPQQEASAEKTWTDILNEHYPDFSLEKSSMTTRMKLPGAVKDFLRTCKAPDQQVSRRYMIPTHLQSQFLWWFNEIRLSGFLNLKYDPKAYEEAMKSKIDGSKEVDQPAHVDDRVYTSKEIDQPAQVDDQVYTSKEVDLPDQVDDQMYTFPTNDFQQASTSNPFSNDINQASNFHSFTNNFQSENYASNFHSSSIETQPQDQNSRPVDDPKFAGLLSPFAIEPATNDALSLTQETSNVPNLFLDEHQYDAPCTPSLIPDVPAHQEQNEPVQENADRPKIDRHIDCLIWAKLLDSNFWPAKVEDPFAFPLDPKEAPDDLENYYPIYFFGSHEYAWVLKDMTRDFEPHYDEFCEVSKHPAFLLGLQEIREPEEWPIRAHVTRAMAVQGKKYQAKMKREIVLFPNEEEETPIESSLTPQKRPNAIGDDDLANDLPKPKARRQSSSGKKKTTSTKKKSVPKPVSTPKDVYSPIEPPVSQKKVAQSSSKSMSVSGTDYYSPGDSYSPKQGPSTAAKLASKGKNVSSKASVPKEKGILMPPAKIANENIVPKTNAVLIDSEEQAHLRKLRNIELQKAELSLDNLKMEKLVSVAMARQRLRDANVSEAEIEKILPSLY